MSKGYWFSLENGTHIYVGEGETPKEATEKVIGKSSKSGKVLAEKMKKEPKKRSDDLSTKENKIKWLKDRIEELKNDPNRNKEIEEWIEDYQAELNTLVGDKSFTNFGKDDDVTDEDILVAIDDAGWSITGKGSVNKYAQNIAGKLGVDKDRVLNVLKQYNEDIDAEKSITQKDIGYGEEQPKQSKSGSDLAKQMVNDDEDYKNFMTISREVGDLSRKNKIDMSYDQMNRMADIINKSKYNKKYGWILENFFRFNKGSSSKSIDKALDMLENTYNKGN